MDDNVNDTDKEPPSEPHGDGKPPLDGDDQIGYGKPPRKHQFQKGKSGNPKGRPKKPKKTPMEEFLTMTSEQIMVRTDAGPQLMSPNEVFVRRLFEDVTKGKQRAIKPWLKLAEQAGILKPPPDPFPTSGVLTTDVAANPDFWDFIKDYRGDDDPE